MVKAGRRDQFAPAGVVAAAGSEWMRYSWLPKSPIESTSASDQEALAEMVAQLLLVVLERPVQRRILAALFSGLAAAVGPVAGRQPALAAAAVLAVAGRLLARVVQHQPAEQAGLHTALAVLPASRPLLMPALAAPLARRRLRMAALAISAAVVGATGQRRALLEALAGRHFFPAQAVVAVDQAAKRPPPERLNLAALAGRRAARQRLPEVVARRELLAALERLALAAVRSLAEPEVVVGLVLLRQPAALAHRAASDRVVVAVVAELARVAQAAPAVPVMSS